MDVVTLVWAETKWGIGTTNYYLLGIVPGTIEENMGTTFDAVLKDVHSYDRVGAQEVEIGDYDIDGIFNEDEIEWLTAPDSVV